MEGREFYVAFIDEKIDGTYRKLKRGKFEDKQLYKVITRAIDDLKENPGCGLNIQKNLIPKEYIKKYKRSNK